MSDYKAAIRKAFGVKADLAISFVNSKKVLVKYDMKEKVIENVTRITVLEGPAGTVVGVEHKEGDDMVRESAECSKYEGITILD